jgi:hypothetical protein
VLAVQGRAWPTRGTRARRGRTRGPRRPSGPGTSRRRDPSPVQQASPPRRDRRVIESQSVQLSANFLGPERRSDDGRMILEIARAGQKTGSDLLFCGAPLRNRTVDLLLTIHTSLGSLPGKHFPQAAGKRRSGSCPGLRRLRSLRPSRLQPSSSWHGSMPSVRSARPRRACHSSLASGLHAGQPRPLRRSDDLPIPPAQDPKTTLSRRIPVARKNLNQCPYLHLAGKPPGAAQESCRAQDHTAEHVEAQSQAPWPPERGR